MQKSMPSKPRCVRGTHVKEDDDRKKNKFTEAPSVHVEDNDKRPNTRTADNRTPVFSRSLTASPLSALLTITRDPDFTIQDQT